MQGSHKILLGKSCKLLDKMLRKVAMDMTWMGCYY